MKTCRACKTKFVPNRPFEVWCSPECGFKIAIDRQDKAKKAKEVKDRREVKAKLKTRQDWLKEAQSVFNLWIRTRDSALPCISCNRRHSGQYHAGHYRSRGAIPTLAFHPDNCHKQCSACNNHKSGNVVEYRINLLKKIGSERVAFLEGPHEPKHYTVDDLKEIKAMYKLKLKELKGND